MLLDCLKRLDYRGYDSAGVLTVGEKLNLFKDVGDISVLRQDIPDFDGNLGIGHTRWATHGGVCRENAHPHLCCNSKIAVVHNGIVENFAELREELQGRGHVMCSETDTELIAHLIEENYSGNLERAVKKALKKIRGSYALAVVCEDEPDKLVGARRESPLIIGVGDNEQFLASDIPALLQYTNRVINLEDGELCVLSKGSMKVYDERSHMVSKQEYIVDWDVQDAEKAGFAHFMLKEIFEQPETVVSALRGRISEIQRTIMFQPAVEQLLRENVDHVQIIACGTSFYASYVGKYLMEQLANMRVGIELSSEFRFYGVKDENTLVVAVTQSGETADTIAALKQAKNAGCKTLVITNVAGSTATRIADAFILTQSGPEIGVAATKTFTSQLMVLYLLALKLGALGKQLSADMLYEHIARLRELPGQIRQILERSDGIKQVADIVKNAHSVFYIGRGVNYPLALEGALKLKEISYIHAEGFAAGELKHGPFALLTEDTPVVAIDTRDMAYDKLLVNIGEIKARGSPVIAVAEDDDSEIEKHADFVLRFPSKSLLPSCLPIVVVLQLLAYHVAALRNCSIDKPRNLAKSVTVE